MAGSSGASDELRKNAVAEHAKRVKEAEASGTQDAARQSLVTEITARITATGRYRDVDAATIAESMASVFTTLGERTKRDPLQLFEQFGPTVRSTRLVGDRVGARTVARDALPGEGRVDAVSTHPEMDRAGRDAEMLRDLFKGVPLGAEGDNVLSGESLASMLTLVRGVVGQNPEILGAIVRSVPVDVVNNLFGSERAAEQALRDEPMLKDGAALDAELPVPLSVDAHSPVGLLLREAARQAAKGPLVPSGATGQTGEGGAALGANQVHLQDSPRGPHARILFGDNGTTIIELFQSANLSSFLHESAHLYLELLGQLVQTADPTSSVIEDFGVIRSWLGATEGKPFTREQHEKFARGFEAYLLEGKAPSQSLRAAFARFRTWMLALYKSVAGLNVELTDEIRGVFDRMLATDIEIDAAENEAAVTPLFTTAEDAGKTEVEFAAYKATVEAAHVASVEKLQAQLFAEKKREATAWWKEARAETRAHAEAEVQAQPVYVARTALKRGKIVAADGTEEVVRRLNKAEIIAAKGEEFLSRVKGLYAATNGLPLEQAAEQFGYTSGDELLQALVEAAPEAQVIEALTDERMKAQYGDMMTDGTIADAAAEAVRTEHQADVIRAEMRALRKLERTVEPHVKAARKADEAEAAEGRETFAAGIPDPAWVADLARERIAILRVRDLKPHVYWVAARKASKLATELAAKKDYTGALNAKHAELLNNELYRQAVNAKAEADAHLAFVKKLQSTAGQQSLGKAGQDYLDQVNRLLERFDFQPLSNRQSDSRASLNAFIAKQLELNHPIDIPEEIQDEANRKPWREMSIEELRGVTDTLKHIVHLSTLKNKLLKASELRTLNEIRDLIAESISAHARRTLPPKPEHARGMDALLEGAGAFVASHRKLASLIRQLDGFEDGGPLWEFVMRPLNEAADRESAFNALATERLEAIFKRHYTKAEFQQMGKKTSAPGLGVSLSKQARLMMALNWGTEDNQQKLVAGWNETLGRSADHPTTSADVLAVLHTLDRRDWQFVQDMWAFLDSYWAETEALARRLDGLPPQKVEGVKVATKFGEIQGQYFPIKYDRSQSTLKHHDVVVARAGEVKRAETSKKSTKAGARHDRVAGVASPIQLDFSVLGEHLSELAQDLTHTETLIDVVRILQGDQVKGAIRAHYGNVVYREIVNAIEAIAAGNVPAQTQVGRVASYLRSGATVVGLGWNLVTSALQPLGLTNSIVRIGPKWVGKGIAEWLGDGLKMENTAKWIAAKSPMMRYRTTTQMREIAELMNAIGFNNGFMAALADRTLDAVSRGHIDLEDMKQSYFWFITRMQLVADIPTWLGAYHKALSEMPVGEVDDARAVALADQAVLDSQSGGAMKDLASVQRGNEWMKIFTNFYSFMNLAFQQHHEALAKMDIKKPGSIGLLQKRARRAGERRKRVGRPKNGTTTWSSSCRSSTQYGLMSS